MSEEGFYARLGTQMTCPRCFNKEGLLIRCEMHDTPGIVVSHIAYPECPRCGWTSRMFKNRFLHFMFEYQIGGKLGWKIMGGKLNPFGVLLFIGIVYLMIFYIFPQVMAGMVKA
jgi:hypothetical protein